MEAKRVFQFGVEVNVELGELLFLKTKKSRRSKKHKPFEYSYVKQADTEGKKMHYNVGMQRIW